MPFMNNIYLLPNFMFVIAMVLFYLSNFLFFYLSIFLSLQILHILYSLGNLAFKHYSFSKNLHLLCLSSRIKCVFLYATSHSLHFISRYYTLHNILSAKLYTILTAELYTEL